MTVLAAIGGSTNAIIHRCAVAGRRGITLPLERFGEIAARVPVIADIAPIGTGLMGDLAKAGGVPAVVAALGAGHGGGVGGVGGHGSGGHGAGDASDSGDAAGGDVLRRPLRLASDPVTTAPAFMVVRGNLAPDGAVLKAAAAGAELLRHTGPAVVFHSYAGMRRRMDDPSLEVTKDSVLVLAGCGPVGAGMPEWGNIPIPAKLLREGVTDMVRISDGRMSGTGYGTVVLHVAPESAVGGPLSRIRDGDVITLDAFAGELSVEPGVLDRCAPILPSVGDRRGWPVLHRMHVTQAPEECDYDDFLQARTADRLPFVEPVIGRS
jgi:dihydroxyacid dehydratase/phosphogluconate dehydratase